MNSAIRINSPSRPRRAKAISASEKVLGRQVAQHNEAHAGKGYKFLKSFLSNVVSDPEWSFAKPIYHHINCGEFDKALQYSKSLLKQTYENPDEHFRAVSCASFVKKYPYVGDPKTADQNALLKFLRGERRNRHLNRLLIRRRVSHNTGSERELGGLGLDPSPLVGEMRRFIRAVIGDRPLYKELSREARWGPGANVGVNGRYTNFARKLLSDKWTVTPAALPYVITIAMRLPMFWEILGFSKDFGGTASPMLCIDPQGFEREFRKRVVVVDYNGISYAEKDSDCSRTIAKEPLLNQLVQLATDGVVKVRLRRVGLDLRDQKPNQDKAREGSTDVPNPYCTADLKNASGSIYTELVRELFPSEWFKFLNDTRSPAWRLSEESASHKYHGFVSMGNGFCFPIETLIFASICSACHRYTGTAPDFRVYGDDIIIRQNESGVLQELLRYFGFELNADKSFFFGPFRESCGADWHEGKPVRPVYIHEALDTLSERIRLHNALVRGNPRWAGFLTSCTRDWWPPFIAELTRPFAGTTDEAVDGRLMHLPMKPQHGNWNRNTQTPRWYGIQNQAKPDTEIARHAQFHVALMYGALSGSNSDTPFAERRETREIVTSFSHWGGDDVALPWEGASSSLRHLSAGPYSKVNGILHQRYLSEVTT